jgi:Membrane proteins related to metalloendopeptidases
VTDIQRPTASQAWRNVQPFQLTKSSTGKGYHLGADYNLGGGDDDKGRSVYPASAGVISSLQSNVCGWGNMIFIRHDTSFGTYTSMYAHVNWLDNGPPLVNTPVDPTVEIALVGNGAWTKTSTCKTSDFYPYHLHFEIREGVNTNAGDGYTKKQVTKGPQGQIDPNDFIRNHQSLP